MVTAAWSGFFALLLVFSHLVVLIAIHLDTDRWGFLE